MVQRTDRKTGIFLRVASLFMLLLPQQRDDEPFTRGSVLVKDAYSVFHGQENVLKASAHEMILSACRHK